VWKIGFIFKILQINCYPLQCTPPPPPPSIHHCIRIFHSKQCCRLSADTLFSRSAVFDFTLSTDSDEYLSTYFSLWGTDKSYRGLNAVNRGSVGTQECSYWLKIASRQGPCELAHCLVVESMISSSKSPSFLQLGQDLQLVFLINCLTLRYPFNHDYASDVEENDHHCLHILLTFHETFMPFKNLRAWRNIITVHLL
jgi:hypothetical protein